MKKNKLILIIILMLFPTLVYASSSSSSVIPLGTAIFMEAFVTIHMTVFVLLPLSMMLSKDNNKKLFWPMFWTRVGVLLFFDIFITTMIAIFDFIMVFIGAFLIVPITSMITKKPVSFKRKFTTVNTNTVNYTNQQESINGVQLKCAKCGHDLLINHKFCTNCGEPFDGNNVTVEPKVAVAYNSFDPMYKLSEEAMIEEFINREITRAGIDKTTNLIPMDILKRKKVMNLIFSILLFVFVSLIFFHFPIYTYIIGLIILFIFYRLTRNYNLVKYLKKQIKARPSEKISNIVMNAKESFMVDNSKNILTLCMCVAIIAPLLIFMEPRIMYEKVDNGYAVRYYTFGLKNFTTATIPETYKGEKVVSLRGNTFSNMYLLKTVNLPDSITEIRGQAFKNNISLKEIILPSNLEYLGGGSFYNCKSLTSIEIPDTVTYIGGESFYNASSLSYIKLSNNITEIRGNTFENCDSLMSIEIPDKVTRIGGHAFYGCSSLTEVTFTENSKLNEIGSSAFRQCDNLYNITLPKDVYINSRAFKESPTTIKRFGETNYGSLIDSSNYDYDTYIYIHTGESKEINQYMSRAQLQNAYITLESVKVNSDSNIFTLKYKDANGEQIFNLSAQEPYKVINNNIAVEISARYILNYDNRVSLNVYYN